jgi:hypothetical protein
MNQIKQMFELQQKLNDTTNGLIWTEGATKEGRELIVGVTGVSHFYHFDFG